MDNMVMLCTYNALGMRMHATVHFTKQRELERLYGLIWLSHTRRRGLIDGESTEQALSWAGLDWVGKVQKKDTGAGHSGMHCGCLNIQGCGVE